jgi:hypothetical protein
MPAIARDQTMGLCGLSALKENIVIRVKRRRDWHDGVEEQGNCANPGERYRDFAGMDGEPGAMQHFFVLGEYWLRNSELDFAIDGKVEDSVRKAAGA